MRVEALPAAQLTAIFTHSDAIRLVQGLRTVLAAHEILTREAVMLRAKTDREKHMNSRVELNLQTHHPEADSQRALDKM